MNKSIDIIKRPKAKNGQGSEQVNVRINKYLLQAAREIASEHKASTNALVETAIYRTYKGIRQRENQLRKEDHGKRSENTQGSEATPSAS